ncbi:MAG: tyrosine-type recombinase/integrase [Thermoanaerobaculia bacterium]
MGVARVGRTRSYKVRWLDGGKPPLGIYRQETLHDVEREDAVAYLKKKMAEVAERRPGDGPSRVTFKQLAERYLEIRGPKLAPGWRADVERIIETHFYPRFGARRADQLRSTDVIRFRHDREGKVTGATINREVAVLNIILNFGEAEGWIERNPIPRAKVKPYREQRRTRAFTQEEWHRLVTAFDDPVAWRAHLKKVRRLGPIVTDLSTGESRRHGGAPRPDSDSANAYRERLRAAVTVFQALLVFASRRGEVLDLRWSDVDARHGVVRVRLPKTSRRGLPQKVLPLVGGIKQLLDAQPRGVGDGYVFPRPVDDYTRAARPKGKAPKRRASAPWEERKLSRAFALAKELAGLKERKGTPRTDIAVLHTIRHTAETWLARAGFTETLRNAYLGHVDGSTAGVYTHLEPADLVPLVEKLSEGAGFLQAGDAKGDAKTGTPGLARR